MARRYYANNVIQQTLLASITNSQGTCQIAGSFASWPTQFPFTAEIDKGLASAEIVLVTAIAGTTATITRAYDSVAVSHAAGATLDFVVIARDFDEANAHINSTSGVHGISGHVVGDTDAQTLSNKTLSAPTFSGTVQGGIDASGSLSTDTNVIADGNVSAGGTMAATGAITGASISANGDGKVTGVLVPKSYTTEAAATTALGSPPAGTTVWLTAPTTGPVGPYIWNGTAWFPADIKPPLFKGSIIASGQAIAASANIAYTSSEDPYSAWDNTNHRWVAPAPGLYLVKAQCKWNTTVPSSAPTIQVFKNGTKAVVSPNAPSIASFMGVIVSGFVRCATGDQLAVQVTQGFSTASDSPADNNDFEILWIAS